MDYEMVDAPRRGAVHIETAFTGAEDEVQGLDLASTISARL